MGTRVLFVDDEEMNRILLTTQLVTAGFEVTACSDGASAFAALEGGAFDLAVLDVMMPAPDGVEICRRIRADGHAFPIVFMSGWPDVETQARALAAGGSAFLPRPYRRAQLIATIRSVLA